jgi:hypothetical protein
LRKRSKWPCRHAADKTDEFAPLHKPPKPHLVQGSSLALCEATVSGETFRPDVRFGSKADICAATSHSALPPKAKSNAKPAARPLQMLATSAQKANPMGVPVVRRQATNDYRISGTVCYWSVNLQREKIKSWHRTNVSRVADLLAIRVGRATSQGRGYAASREQAMRYFRARYVGSPT